MSESDSPIPASRPAHERWIIAAAIVLVALLGTGIGFALGSRSSDNNSDQARSSTLASQVANVRQACAGWMQSNTEAQPPGNWCADMSTWMSQNVPSGGSSAAYPWSDPGRMLQACRSWAASTTTSTSPADSPWCDAMVTWMRDHMDDGWDNSMDHGWMMGD